MPKAEIEEFAKVLVKEVRDRAIVSCDNQLQDHANGPVAKRWRENLKDSTCRALAVTMIADCVDDTLFYLLHAIDTGALRLSFTAANGTVVDLTTDGRAELAGWLMGGDGWIAEYSKQRFVDDFVDLR
jgi:hypothetical protein